MSPEPIVTRISNAISKTWPKAEPDIVAYLSEMILRFAESPCADRNYLEEMEVGDPNILLPRVWEAMLYTRFHEQSWSISGPKPGPDFLLETPAKVYVEATAPAPGDPDSANGLLREWQERMSSDASCRKPIDQIILRWTSALKTKKDKHLEDIRKGRADENVPFVVAINSSRLDSDPLGINGLPIAVTAVLPLGPGIVSVEDVATGATLDGPRPERRDTILNANGAPVRNDNFLDPDYACVSALIGCSSFYVYEADRSKFCGQPEYYVVHNPLAKHPLPRPWLPGAIEYVADGGRIRRL